MPSPTRTSPTRNPRRALHERSNSQTNSLAAIRLVPYTPPRLDETVGKDVYSRTPFPTSAAHVFPPLDRVGRQGLYQGSALTSSEGDVSGRLRATKSISTLGSGSTTRPSSSQDLYSSNETAAPRAQPVRKKRKHVAVDPQTKTFKVLEVPDRDGRQDQPGRRQTPVSPTTSHVSHDHLISDTETEQRTISTSSYFRQSTAATSVVSSSPAPETATQSEDGNTKSPWNYQLVGGLRKVPKTPDLKQKANRLDSPPPPLPDVTESAIVNRILTTKPSFQSTLSESTTSDNTNYRVFPGSSPSPYPPDILQAASDHSDEHTLHQYPSSPPEGLHGIENYETYGDSSLATSYVALGPVRTQYSVESLVVPPLQPRARRFSGASLYFKSRSLESLRTGSFTSITSILSQEAARAIVANPQIIHLPAANRSGEWLKSGLTRPKTALMQAHPHVWSSQLSTVASESDTSSNRGSRTWSNLRGSSGQPSGDGSARVRSSLNSSLQPEHGSSNPDSLRRPAPAFAGHGQRLVTGASIRLVEDDPEDERHYGTANIMQRFGNGSAVSLPDDSGEGGDRMGAMPDLLRPRQSKTRLANVPGFYVQSNDSGRTNTMKSSSSSRAGSFLANSIPTWAKVYYGSGERKWLYNTGAPGSSSEGSDSRYSSMRSSLRRPGSPDMANFSSNVYSPRRRPREKHATLPPVPRLGTNEAKGAYTVPSLRYSTYDQLPGTKRARTSSVWSPHLRHDRRADRHNFWQAPSVDWSQEKSALGPRNGQIVMFAMGFICPFAWMIAAFFPLPPDPIAQMKERGSTDIPEQETEMLRQIQPADEKRYESAVWWRNLNRIMAVIGVLVVILVIVLVIVGTAKKW